LPYTAFLTKFFSFKGTRDDPLKPYVSSEIFAEDPGKMAKYRYKYSFHFSPSSWHYGWRSSRYKQNQRHCFQTVLLVPKETLLNTKNEIDGTRYSKDTMVCVAMESTTPFTISSSKRAKEGQEPRQQHLSVTREKIEELGTFRITKKRKNIRRRIRDAKKIKQNTEQEGRNNCIQGAISMFDLPLVRSRKRRSDSLLTLPSDSEHDDDIYIDDQKPVDASTQDLVPEGETDILLQGLEYKEKNILSSPYEDFNVRSAATDEIDNFGLLGSGKREVLPSLHHHALAKLIPSIHGNLEHTQRRLYKPLVKSFGLEEQKRNRSNSWLS